MPQQALFILVGASLYAAVQQWLEATRPGGRVSLHLLSGLLCLLAAAMGTAAWVSGEVITPQALLLTGAIITGLGILAWALLPWLIAVYTGIRSPLMLGMNTALWASLFVANLFANPSLAYQGWRTQAGSHPAYPVWEAVMNPAWWFVELAVVATVATGGLMLSKHYQQQRRQVMTVAFATPLLLLVLASLWDLLVLTRLVAGPMITVAAFLLATPMVAVILSQGRRHPVTPRPVQEQTPAAALLPLLPAEPAAAPARSPDTTDTPAVPMLLPVLPAQRLSVGSTASRPQAAIHTPQPGADEPMQSSVKEEDTVMDDSHETVELTTLQEHLNDIAVYSHMLLGRLERGQWDPKSLQVLCKRLNSEANEIREVLDQHPEADIDLETPVAPPHSPAAPSR